MLKTIFEDLEFIGTVPKGAKPNFSDKTIINNTDWFCTIRRRLKYEKGENGVVYLNSLIGNVEKVIDNLDFENSKKMKNLLIKANIGIENLVYTYRSEDQLGVSKEYYKCSIKIKNLIKKPKGNFFEYCPKIVH